MRNPTRALCSLAAALSLLAPAPRARAADVPASAPRRPLVVAHRGGAALAPENTLGAFANAIRLGADQVECDVHLSRDDAVIVMHDADVDRTTDGHGAIRALTLAQIRALDAAAHVAGGHAREPVPTLGELLDLAKDHIGVQIEIKLDAGSHRDPGIEKRVIREIRRRRMADEVMVISFDFATLRELKARDPGIRTGVLVGDDWFAARGGDGGRALADAIAATGADAFLASAAPVDSATVRAARGRGVLLGVWTLDAPEDLKLWSALGVDAITTNRPDVLLRLRDGGAAPHE